MDVGELLHNKTFKIITSPVPILGHDDEISV